MLNSMHIFRENLFLLEKNKESRLQNGDCQILNFYPFSENSPYY